MFGQVGWGEMLVLLLVGLFVFGPERLPKVAKDAGRMLRQLRQLVSGVQDDLKAELGPEVADLDLRSLHPKTFVHKHLFGDDDEPAPAETTMSHRTMAPETTPPETVSLDKTMSLHGSSPPSPVTPPRPPGPPPTVQPPTGLSPAVQRDDMVPYDVDAT